MKIDRNLLIAALGLASVSLASATQYVYVTGSTAARDAVYNTLIAGVGFDSTTAPAFIGYGSTVAGNCSYMEFLGTVGGVQTIVEAHWSGSEAGIADVSGTGTETFANDAVNTFPAAGAAHAVANLSGTPSTTQTAPVDWAQADNALSFSKIPTSNATQKFDNLAIPFVFVENKNSLGNVGNITSQNFLALANGGDTLSLFTGNVNDSALVYLTGRDNNSGTRVNTFGITGFGIKSNPSQIIITQVGTSGNAAWNGTFTTSGQSSGGTLATTLTYDSTSAGWIAVGYLGLADNATAVAGGATDLEFNGVPYSQTAVEQGPYALWGKEYTVEKNGIGSAAATVANAVASGIENYTTGYEIPYSDMNVDRTGPTGFPL